MKRKFKINWRKAVLPLVGIILISFLISIWFTGLLFLLSHYDNYLDVLDENIEILGLTFTYRHVLLFMSFYICMSCIVSIIKTICEFFYKKLDESIVRIEVNKDE